MPVAAPIILALRHNNNNKALRRHTNKALRRHNNKVLRRHNNRALRHNNNNNIFPIFHSLLQSAVLSSCVEYPTLEYSMGRPRRNVLPPISSSMISLQSSTPPETISLTRSKLMHPSPSRMDGLFYNQASTQKYSP
jgi:hypothetical protein